MGRRREERIAEGDGDASEVEKFRMRKFHAKRREEDLKADIQESWRTYHKPGSNVARLGATKDSAAQQCRG